MKNYLLPVTFVILLIACNKDNIKQEFILFDKGTQEFGWATGNANGKDWEASGHWIHHISDMY